ncbi:interferon-induced protein with tetratricopeptide repeats 1B-like [Brienomyrus brachyistius]|uniref:interferon-induced protein with tetratricopeptide repeats 1B-like n=1 Tax=Brienomyrus brachyistius TaxID=42636 RepID=UPI0020B1B735|nr:interferon-induced protein with tetratricopeptide repeats 1B-like [Brienomyrus brachyistius]XP_048843004.1 interferon-induced protein with tetratricopeptide repeats 1B-like [Brienomyrus brachyistius]
MALNQETSLKIKLIQLQCHFTWGLRKEDTDLSNLQNRLEDDINFSSPDQAGGKHLFSYLAFVNYLQDQPEEALANLAKAEDHIRKHNKECEKMLIVTYGNFAWLYYHLNDHAKSMSYLEKVEDIKQRFPTQSPTAFHAEVYGEMGWTFLMYSKTYHEKAKECFEKALKEYPDNPDWNCGYATALYRVESESNTTADSPATKQLRRALELSPGDSYIMALLGLKLADCGILNEAEELIEQALMISPTNPHVMRYVAKFFRRYGSMDKAINLVNCALEKTPNSAFLHHQIAVCYRNKRINLCRNGGRNNNREEVEHLLLLAIHHFEKAIEMKSSFVTAITDLALLHAEKRNLTKAEELFQEAFQVARAKNDDLQDVHKSYGDFQLYHKRSVSLAIEHYMKGCQIRKDNRAGEQCVQKLEMIAKRRIDRNPSDGEAFGILGYVNKLRGDKLQAIECYEKALLHSPGNGEFLTALCDLRLSLH